LTCLKTRAGFIQPKGCGHNDWREFQGALESLLTTADCLTSKTAWKPPCGSMSDTKANLGNQAKRVGLTGW